MATKKTTSSKAKTTKKTTAKKATVKKPAVKKNPTAKPTPKAKTVHATEPYHPAFGAVILVVCALMLATLLPFAIKMIAAPSKLDALKFSKEYSLVEKDNVFRLKSAKDTIKILEHGTGIVFLGFPSCPWCQNYAKLVNDLAKEKGVESIYYYDIYNDRKDNTEDYQKLVAILGDHLQYDENGEKRIYVPNLTFVVDGEIVGNDLETSKDTLGLDDPNEYWTEERASAWKERVGTLMDKVLEKTGCETTCNE